MWNVVVAPRWALQQPPRRTSSPLVVGGKAFKVWTSSVTLQKMGKLKGFQQESSIYSIWTSEKIEKNLEDATDLTDFCVLRIFWASCCEEEATFLRDHGSQGGLEETQESGPKSEMSHYNRWITIISSVMMFLKGGDHVVQKNMRNAAMPENRPWKKTKFGRQAVSFFGFRFKFD